MAGLLSGIGQVLAGGVAGGAKAAGESFVEQAKQEALAAREENMLRIQEKFAKAGRKETQEFQAGESKLGRESAQKLSDQTQVGANIRQAAALTSAENLAEIERLSRSEEAAAAATAAQKLLTFKNNLPDKEKSTVEKAVLGLERLGMPRAQALAVALSSVTKEESAEERALLRTWQTVFTENKKSGETAEEAARQATTLTGVDPVELVSQMRARRSGAGSATTKTAATGEFDLQSFLKTLNPSGSQVTKKAENTSGKPKGATRTWEPDSTKGLIEGETTKPYVPTGRSAMGVDTMSIFGPRGQKRIDLLNKDLKAGVISKEAYDKAIVEAEAEVKAGL